MPGPAAASAPPPTVARPGRVLLLALPLLLLTLLGSFAVRTGDRTPGGTGHDFAMADTDGADAGHELGVPGGCLTSLLLPELFAPLRPGDPVLPGGNLAARGLLGTWLPWQLLYLGWLPLLLALLACFDLGAPDRLPGWPAWSRAIPWVLRAAFLSGLWQVGRHPRHPGPVLDAVLLASAAGLAAWGLASLLAAGRRTTGAMALAVVALALAAAQSVWALSAGSAGDEAALRPLLGLVDETSRAHLAGDPTLAALNAAHLRDVLDRAALTGFASLCALLWFLKRRDGLGVAGLLLVVAADFGWHLFGSS